MYEILSFQALSVLQLKVQSQHNVSYVLDLAHIQLTVWNNNLYYSFVRIGTGTNEYKVCEEIEKSVVCSNSAPFMTIQSKKL